MICGLLICIAFGAGWFIGEWQTARHWEKWCYKSLEFADFWQTEFINLLNRLEPMRVKQSDPVAGSPAQEEKSK